MPLTPEQQAELKQLYLHHSASKIAEMFGVTLSVVRNNLHNLGIKKESKINTGQYKIGDVPFNKGKKMPQHVYERVKHTMFKKGNKPHIQTLYRFAEAYKKIVQDEREIPEIIHWLLAPV